MPGAKVQRGERVTLRTVEREDLEFVQRAYANPELGYPLGWEVKNRTKLEEKFEDGPWYDGAFLVCLDDDGAGAGPPDTDEVRRIGCVVAGTSEHARSGIGFWLVPAAQGPGYGTEAVSLLLDYLFRVYPHPAVYANALPDNEASRALLESLGFLEEGRARQEAFWDGTYRDTIVYSILREEWEG